MDALRRLCAALPEAAPNCATGFYGYTLNVPANGIFAMLFGITTLAYAVLYARKTAGFDFTIFMQLGLLAEDLGHGARV